MLYNTQAEIAICKVTKKRGQGGLVGMGLLGSICQRMFTKYERISAGYMG